MNFSSEILHNVIEQTRPAQKYIENGAWRFREGSGGGKRVSAVTLENNNCKYDIKTAEDFMSNELKHRPLFLIRETQIELDKELEARGYLIIDQMNIYAAPAKCICNVPPPKLSTFEIWEPIEIQKDIWRKGGLSSEKLKVMDRVLGHKTSILMRWENKPAGAAFVATYDYFAMVHALEVTHTMRRKGVAKLAIRKAALWSLTKNAHTLLVLCTKQNVAANRLYTSLKMELVSNFHYRVPRDLK